MLTTFLIGGTALLAWIITQSQAKARQSRRNHDDPPDDGEYPDGYSNPVPWL